MKQEGACNYDCFFGLDLSLNSTGIAVFSTEDMILLETSSLVIDKKKHSETKNKLAFIGSELLKYKKTYMPQYIVLEMGFMRYVKSTAQLMRVHGVVNYLFADLEQFEIPATTVKQALTGKGNSDKQCVAKAVLQYYPTTSFSTDDESDACAVAICWAIQKGWL